MGDGFNPPEPNARKYCEVIQIGIEDDTPEVTLYYTPERGLSLNLKKMILCSMIQDGYEIDIKRWNFIHLRRI